MFDKNFTQLKNQKNILAVLNASGEMKFVSEGFCSILDRPCSELKNKFFLDFIEDKQDVYYHLQFVKDNRAVATEYVSFVGCGEEYLIELSPTINADNGIDEIYIIQKGADDGVSLYSELEISNKRLKDLKFAIDQSVIVAMTDSRGVINYVNDMFCKISQYSPEELMGQDHRIINSGVHDKSFFKELWGQIQSGKVWRGEVCNKAKDGSIYWVFTTIIPFMDNDNKPYQFISLRHDITEQKCAQIVLDKERARSLYSEKMATLGIMASGIAHELGNPLAALQGRLEMLNTDAKRGDVSPEGVLKVTERLLKLSDRMNKIIRGLRAYARDGSLDKFNLTSMTNLIIDLLELVESNCQKLNITIKTKGLDKDIMLWCRETEIGQVLINLINNSIDAIKDLDEKWIYIELTESTDNIKIIVRDSGPGIPEAIIEKVFDPFYTTKPVGQGTGLGLSISTTLIESHGGRLKLKQKDKNTCFEVVLPKKQDHMEK